MIRLIALIAAIAVLQGCAILRAPITDTKAPSQQLLAKWQARVAELSPVETFTVRGRVASGSIGFKADMRWKQHADGRFEMRVAGPFGARAAELAGDQNQVLVRTGKDDATTTTEPELWLEQALGVRLPVSGLRWWAMGLPAPDNHFDMLLDPEGRALRIVQNGWELNFPEYRAQPGLPELPRRIEARNGDTRVLVLADAWSNLGPIPKSPAPADNAAPSTP